MVTDDVTAVVSDGDTWYVTDAGCTDHADWCPSIAPSYCYATDKTCCRTCRAHNIHIAGASSLIVYLSTSNSIALSSSRPARELDSVTKYGLNRSATRLSTTGRKPVCDQVCDLFTGRVGNPCFPGVLQAENNYDVTISNGPFRRAVFTGVQNDTRVQVPCWQKALSCNAFCQHGP